MNIFFRIQVRMDLNILLVVALVVALAVALVLVALLVALVVESLLEKDGQILGTGRVEAPTSWRVAMKVRFAEHPFPRERRSGE